MKAADRLRSRIAELEAQREAEALRLCSKFRGPNEPGPTVEQVHERRVALELQLKPLRRRLAILEKATTTTSI